MNMLYLFHFYTSVTIIYNNNKHTCETTIFSWFIYYLCVFVESFNFLYNNSKYTSETTNLSWLIYYLCDESLNFLAYFKSLYEAFITSVTSIDPDQLVHPWHLIWIYTVCLWGNDMCDTLSGLLINLGFAGILLILCSDISIILAKGHL